MQSAYDHRLLHWRKADFAVQTCNQLRTLVNEKTSQRVRGLIQGVASGGFEKGSDAQKVGDYYASFMDENGIEAKKLAPLSDETTSVGLITVALTPAGRVVLPRARQLLAAGEDLYCGGRSCSKRPRCSYFV